MKNNVTFALAKASIEHDKKNYLISFIMMTIAFTFTIVFSTYLTTSEKAEHLIRKMNYGDWVVCYENLNEETKNILTTSTVVEKVTDLKVNGLLENQNYIADYSEDYFNIGSIELLEGDIPHQSNEVVVTKKSGYKINDIIDINIIKPVKETRQYKVVGIINDYNTLWDTPSVDYFTAENQYYKEYSYITSSQSVHTFVGLDDCIFNFSRLSQNVSYELYDDWGTRSMSLGNNASNTTMNTFILVVLAGLFIAISFNIAQREKTVFLLRCIGMSKRDMKKYIYYEVIIVTLIALALSIVLGIILAFIACFIYYLITGVFIFFSSLLKSFIYVGILLVFIIAFVYISLLPISIHSMDSLIHKKDRKVMKKYNRARRMTISTLSSSIMSRHWNFVLEMVILIVVQLMCVNAALENYDLYHDVSNEMTSTYSYTFDINDQQLISELQDTMTQLHEFKYVDANLSVDTYVTYPLTGLEGRLIEGRLPENKYECLSYDAPNYSIRYDIGRTFPVEDENFTVDELTVVGKINLDDFYELDSIGWFLPVRGHMLVVKDDAVKEDKWLYMTHLKTNKDVFFEIKEVLREHGIIEKNSDSYYLRNGFNYNVLKENNNYKNEAINNVMLSVPVFIIDVFFVFLVVKLLVDKINKDLKLMRCLGMTFKQTVRTYIHIGASIGICSLYYLIPQIMLLTQYLSYADTILLEDVLILLRPILIIIVIGVVNLGAFAFYAYKKTVDTVTFYPTEVERYY